MIVDEAIRTAAEARPILDGVARPRLRCDDLPLYVEVSPLLTPRLTGIGRFVARLIEALARRKPLRLITTTQGRYRRSMRLSKALRCGQEIRLEGDALCPADADLSVWTRRLFYRSTHRQDAAFMHRCCVLYTMLRPPERRFRRELGMLYDFTPLLMPQVHLAETREQFGPFFARDAVLCDKLIAISKSTKVDASWLCDVGGDDVAVGYPGPSVCVQEHAHRRPVQRRRNLILVVSTLEPRKNARFLYEWFLNTSVLPATTELWWVGPSGWLFTLGDRRTGLSPRSRRIRFLGHVSDQRLCELYQTAAFTIYPSLYEGFGFPVLDSLRHGTPVLCSFNSSLPEFGGPGVSYFDGCDPASLDVACRELVARGPLVFARDDLAQRFCWDALARQVISLTSSEAPLAASDDEGQLLPESLRRRHG